MSTVTTSSATGQSLKIQCLAVYPYVLVMVLGFGRPFLVLLGGTGSLHWSGYVSSTQVGACQEIHYPTADFLLSILSSRHPSYVLLPVRPLCSGSLGLQGPIFHPKLSPRFSTASLSASYDSIARKKKAIGDGDMNLLPQV